VREELERRARSILPHASDEELEKIVDLACRLPGEVFNRPNLRGLMVI